MGGIEFDVEVREDAESIRKDIEKEIGYKLYGPDMHSINIALYEDMKDALWTHIKEDVYAGYQPTEYLRRKDHTGMGESLLDTLKNKERTQNIAEMKNGKLIFGLSYEPTAEHENPEWIDPDMTPDQLIGRIEKKQPKYNFNPKKGEIPDRPFWQNFVSEMIEGGRFARVLDDILKQTGIAEPGDSISGVMRDSSDGNY